LNAATGSIGGTPTAPLISGHLTFMATDSSVPAQSKPVALVLTIDPAVLSISTTSLPFGEVGAAYSSGLVVTGGTPPYSWTVSSGALPAGLILTPATGTVSGTPSGSASGPLIFTVTDSGSPAQEKSITLTLTISPANITVSASPKRSGLTETQTLPLTATTDDLAGVSWAASGGSLSATRSESGVAVTYTAPSSPGAFTITATSVTDSAVNAVVAVFVTDLSGVYTYHNDLARDGANTHEYALSPSLVSTATFGKLFSCPVDGAVYAQPLWVANLMVNGALHNVVFVATEHDSVYAFDADTAPCLLLWHASLIDGNHGGTTSNGIPLESSVPAGGKGTNYLVGTGVGILSPEVGVTGTPVIDPSTNTLYVCAQSVNVSGPTFYQRLHAIDLLTGNEKFGVPANITSSNVTYPGVGDGSSTVSFNPRQENQRAGLALVNGTIYVAWASFDDNPPYYGWVAGFKAANLSIGSVLNVTPNVQYGGIWMSGGGPSADENGNLYLSTGNGGFDANSASKPSNDYGDSFLQVSPKLSVNTYFTPSDEASDEANDRDFGAGGATVVLNLAGGNPAHLVISGDKDGTFYLLNGDKMGGFGDSAALEYFSIGVQIRGTGAFWNNNFYVAGCRGPLLSYAFNGLTELFAASPSSKSSWIFRFPGATPSVSAEGSSNGIVWALDNSNFCLSGQSCGPAVLHAFDATNLSDELWNSGMAATDAAGYAVKFTVPTIANGKVYVGTRGNNTGGAVNSTSTPGELDVYGLKPS
jgi:hypothetical protein